MKTPRVWPFSLVLALLGAIFCGPLFAAGDSGITLLHTFPLAPASPVGPLVLAADHNLYGVSQSGGTANLGTIFMVTPTGTFSIVASFTGTAGTLPGRAPQAGLVVGKDGNLYGTTAFGGSSDLGTVFKYVPGAAATMLAAFTGASGALPGSNPNAAFVVLPNGDMYSTTPEGGTFATVLVDATGNGTVFKVSAAGAVCSVASFTGNAGTLPGATPCGTLALGSDGNLYGVTTNGGNVGINPYSNEQGNEGTVYQVVPGGAVTCLQQLAGNIAPLGRNPVAGLTAAPDGNLYGTTPEGGGSEFGTVFQLTTGGQLTTMAEFDSTLPGRTPQGPLTVAPDGNLYGTTSSGGTGAYPNGTIFKLVPGGAATSVYTFQQSGPTTGSNPTGALVVGSDGNLYGAFIVQNPNSGYVDPTGAIFEFVPGGAVTLAGLPGGSISGPLAAGGDGNLYGVCNQGGTGGSTPYLSTLGLIFKVAPGGPVTPVYEVGNPEGVLPNNFTKAPDGNFYGFVFNGTNQDLIQMTATGTITARATVPGTSTQQGGPFPSPLIAGSDGNLWGTLGFVTPQGGYSIAGVGDVIKVVSTGTGNVSIDIVTELPGPPGGLVLGHDGNIYGTVLSTGPSGPAGVYQITPAGSYTLEGTLDGAPAGNEPDAFVYTPMTVGADGNIYGTTTNGGVNHAGSIFQVVPGVGVTTVASFGSGGLLESSPSGLLVAASDGNLFGTTIGAVPSGPPDGGGGITLNAVARTSAVTAADATPTVVDSDLGTIFRYTPGGTATTIAAFSGASGALPGQNPTGALIAGSNGSLYGIASVTESGYDGIYGSGPYEIYKVPINGAASVLGALPSGAGTFSPLFLAGDGAVYAASENAGASDLGFIFRVGADDSLTIPYNFTGDNGANPTYALFPGDATHFCGLAFLPAGGTVYSVNTAGPHAQTVLFPPVADPTYGGSVTIATSSSLLPLTYTTTGPVQIVGNVATFTGVGPVTVTASQPGNANFTAAPAVTQSFQVDPATLTYWARTSVRAVGFSNPVLSGYVEGFVNGDTQQSATTGTLTFTSSATSSAVAGLYPIVGSGLSAANYIFNQAQSNDYALHVVTAATYSAWQSAYGDYEDTTGAETPLNDGVPEMMKYVFDINPSGSILPADRAALPTVGLDDTTHPETTDLTLTYRKNVLASAIVVSVQVSTDMQTWTTVPPEQLDINEVMSTDPVTGDSMMKVGVPVTRSTQFIRLSVPLP